MNVRLLDCTLRDGGYVNNWEFGRQNIEDIIAALVSAGMDFIECGFLKPCAQLNSSLFDGIYKGKNPVIGYIKKYPEQKFSLMINAGEFDVNTLQEENVSGNMFIRIAFRKDVLERAVADARILIEKAFNVFLNPMFINTYTEQELDYLINIVNDIKPYALCITDTSGSLVRKDIIKLAGYIDKRLLDCVTLDFHSHNNLNCSLENALAFAGLGLKRDLIIDCCVSGMGRGAGNLDTAKIIKKLGGYDVRPVNKCAGKIISKIYKTSPWGVSYALYNTAKMLCHPDYAGILESDGIKTSMYKKVLSCIPEDSRYRYNKTVAEKLINNLKDR